MKKTLSILAVTVIAASAFAQGTLTFNNPSTGLIRIEGTSAAGAAGAKVQFAWAPEGAVVTPYSFTSLSLWLAANPSVTLVDATANVGVPLAGRFSGGVLTINTPQPGAVVQGFVVGWAGGAAFDSATYVGISNPFIVDTGDPTASPAGTPGNINAFTGLNLTVVPEPGTFALAGLGAAAMLIFRRRN